MLLFYIGFDLILSGEFLYFFFDFGSSRRSGWMGAHACDAPRARCAARWQCSFMLCCEAQHEQRALSTHHLLTSVARLRAGGRTCLLLTFNGQLIQEAHNAMVSSTAGQLPATTAGADCFPQSALSVKPSSMWSTTQVHKVVFGLAHGLSPRFCQSGRCSPCKHWELSQLQSAPVKGVRRVNHVA